MPWRSRRYDWTSVPDIQQSTVGEFAPILAFPVDWCIASNQTLVQEAGSGWSRPFSKYESSSGQRLIVILSRRSEPPLADR
jgi:hypothetical protein